MNARVSIAWVVAAVVALGCLSACDLAYVDPTDDANFSYVTFVNDSGSPVVLFDCLDTRGRECHDMSGRLAPGERLKDQRVYWGGGLDPWQVRDTHGRLVGWLLVNSPRREVGAVYYVSDAESQPDKPTAPRVSPHPAPTQ